MLISDLIASLEQLARPDWQEDYDNTGLLLGDRSAPLERVLVSLDVTEAVVKEAAAKKAGLIVAHHPLIFRGLKTIDPATDNGRAVAEAIRQNIAVYAIHTNLDNVLPGVNSEIADRLGLQNVRPLVSRPHPAPDRSPGQRLGSGLIGALPEPVAEGVFLEHLRKRFAVPVVRHTDLTGRPVRTVAVCGGAGSFLIARAFESGADFFVTADVKYHEFFGAEGRGVLADIGHFESEQFTVDFLVREISGKFRSFAVLKAETRTNPVHYYF